MLIKQKMRLGVSLFMVALLLSGCGSGFIPSGDSAYCTGEWSTCKLFTENKIALKRDNKWGYLDKLNKQAIEFKFDAAAAFANGVAIVKLGTTYNIIDGRGKTLLDTGYDRLVRDVDDRVMIYRKNSKYGLLSEGGNQITGPIYDSFIGLFTDGRLAVKSGVKYGYIDKTGDMKIPAIYEEAYEFSRGLALVKYNGAYGYINNNGSFIIPATLVDAYSFDDYDRAIVQPDDETIALIDKTGTQLFTASDIYGSGPLYDVELPNGDLRLYSYEGTPFTTHIYTYISIYGPYVANVEWDEGLESFDEIIIFGEDGETLVSVPYIHGDAITSTDNKPYISDDSDGFVLKSAQIEIDLPGIDGVDMITDEHIVVDDGEKSGVMTLQTISTIVIPLQYDNLILLPDGFAIARNELMIGVLTMSGSTLIPFEYSDFNFFANLLS